MVLGKRVKNQWVSEEEHDFIIGTAMNHYGVTHPTRWHRHFKIMFLFLDSLIFFAFVQNNHCGTKLKAISCRHKLRNLLSITVYTSWIWTIE